MIAVLNSDFLLKFLQDFENGGNLQIRRDRVVPSLSGFTYQCDRVLSFSLAALCVLDFSSDLLI